MKQIIIKWLGWLLYRIKRPFTKTIEPLDELVEKLGLKKLKTYKNKQKLRCVDLLTNGYTLTLAVQDGYLLMRMHNKVVAVDKYFKVGTWVGKDQQVAGVINSMLISLRDKEARFNKFVK